MRTRTAKKPRIAAKPPAKKSNASKLRETASRKPAGRKSAAKLAKPVGLGALPEWDLSALYPAIDSPDIKRDLARIDAECNGFEERYKGKLAALTQGAGGGASPPAAVKAVEAIDAL